MEVKTRDEKIAELKLWFGWKDDRIVAHLTPRDLATAYKIMTLEKEEQDA